MQRGDKVLRLSTAYGQVCELLDWLVQISGIEVIVAQVDFPVTGPDQVIQAVGEALRRAEEEVEEKEEECGGEQSTAGDGGGGGGSLKLCVFSHISSMVSRPLGL